MVHNWRGLAFGGLVVFVLFFSGCVQTNYGPEVTNSSVPDFNWTTGHPGRYIDALDAQPYGKTGLVFKTDQINGKGSGNYDCPDHPGITQKIDCYDVFVGDSISNAQVIGGYNGLLDDSARINYVSPNGEFVIFSTVATNAVQNDNNNINDFFKWQNGDVTRITEWLGRESTEYPKSCALWCIGVSATNDGQEIAFTSNHDFLTDQPTSTPQVWLKAAATIVKISEGYGASYLSERNLRHISEGGKIVFLAHPTAPSSGCPEHSIIIGVESAGCPRAILWENGETRELGQGTTIEHLDLVFAASISSDGQFAFLTGKDDGELARHYRLNLNTNELVEVSKSASGLVSPVQPSDDGARAMYIEHESGRATIWAWTPNESSSFESTGDAFVRLSADGTRVGLVASPEFLNVDSSSVRIYAESKWQSE